MRSTEMRPSAGKRTSSSKSPNAKQHRSSTVTATSLAQMKRPLMRKANTETIALETIAKQCCN